jgi:hypothetical protein
MQMVETEHCFPSHAFSSGKRTIEFWQLSFEDCYECRYIDGNARKLRMKSVHVYFLRFYSSDHDKGNIVEQSTNNPQLNSNEKLHSIARLMKLLRSSIFDLCVIIEK